MKNTSAPKAVAQPSEIAARITLAKHKTESSRKAAEEAKAGFKRARKAHKHAKKLAKAAKRELKALKKLLVAAQLAAKRKKTAKARKTTRSRKPAPGPTVILPPLVAAAAPVIEIPLPGELVSPQA